MKYFLLILLSFSFLSCNSVKKTEQALNSGDYLTAISTAVNKLQKDKFSKKSPVYASLLKQAFEGYRTTTLNKIDFLERETLKDNSKEVYQLYVQLQSVQNRIKPLTPLNGMNSETIPFELYDFSENILVGKENYANYLYTKATDFLRTNNKIDSRLAYNSLVELEELAPNFNNTSSLKREAYLKGVDFVLVSLYNDTQQAIPNQVEDRLLNFSTYNLDDFWTEYHNNARKDIKYDYAIDINFNGIQFSPERLLERQIPLEREVVDGWRYKTDRAGNYLRDDEGNRIKEDILVLASGTLFETVQSKEVKASAVINYFNLATEQKINSYPLESIFVFENNFANFQGDTRVLNQDEAYLLRNGPIDYPSNERMLIDASEDIKSKLKQILMQYSIN